MHIAQDGLPTVPQK